jgi:hypothetical protein
LSMPDDEPAAADTTPPSADTPTAGRPAPPPITWDTEVNYRAKDDPHPLRTPIEEVVRKVIRGKAK